MSDDKVIDITELIKKKKELEVKNLKKQLDLAVDDLGIDIDEIINTFVFFDPTAYYLNKEDDLKEDLVLGSLESSYLLLEEMGHQKIADEIQNIIFKVNNLFGEDNED